MPDRHKEPGLTLRLGADRERAEKAAARAGLPIRKWILAAVREKLGREEALASMGEES